MITMHFRENSPPRIFTVGLQRDIKIADTGNVFLQPDEQVSFVTRSGKEHDFVAKSWGFYATPSVNGRLKDQGFKTALVKNSFGKYYIMVVELEHLQKFDDYLRQEKNVVVEWLDERGSHP